MRENPCVLRLTCVCQGHVVCEAQAHGLARRVETKTPWSHTANLMPLPAVHDSSTGGLAGVKKMASCSCGSNFLLCSAKEARLGSVQGDGEEMMCDTGDSEVMEEDKRKHVDGAEKPKCTWHIAVFIDQYDNEKHLDGGCTCLNVFIISFNL